MIENLSPEDREILLREAMEMTNEGIEAMNGRLTELDERLTRLDATLIRKNDLINTLHTVLGLIIDGRDHTNAMFLLPTEWHETIERLDHFVDLAQGRAS